jgi:hypothetical protein
MYKECSTATCSNGFSRFFSHGAERRAAEAATTKNSVGEIKRTQDQQQTVPVDPAYRILNPPYLVLADS